MCREPGSLLFAVCSSCRGTKPVSKVVFPPLFQSLPSWVILVSYCNRYFIFKDTIIISFLVISFLLPKKYLDKMEVHSSFSYHLFDYRKELKDGIILLLCLNCLYQAQSICCSLLFPVTALLPKCPPLISLWCMQFKPHSII